MHSYRVKYTSKDNTFSVVTTIQSKDKGCAMLKAMLLFRSMQEIPEVLKKEINRQTVSIKRLYKQRAKVPRVPKIHYANIVQANESDTEGFVGGTYCGMDYTGSPITNKIKDVTCERCQKIYLRKKDGE